MKRKIMQIALMRTFYWNYVRLPSGELTPIVLYPESQGEYGAWIDSLAIPYMPHSSEFDYITADMFILRKARCAKFATVVYPYKTMLPLDAITTILEEYADYRFVGTIVRWGDDIVTIHRREKPLPRQPLMFDDYDRGL
ncbi:MAG: hypothetical protein RML40_10900 [Bacteroidota bacterium]|nr:hypothetical protein [Candidatus Kapabacteria bacterium]MDW8221022.1 hypothetical protein [Bacteroidota bacterium]